MTDEARLQADIEALRPKFPDTQDLYREVCMILFFRYGITPTEAECIEEEWLDDEDQMNSDELLQELLGHINKAL